MNERTSKTASIGIKQWVLDLTLAILLISHVKLGNSFVLLRKNFGLPGFGKTNITASNDLNEETLDALNKQVRS
ncbi:hypothetical protein RND71_032821 [Anisodus tanguticus]|uniref:Uncharacterized protein n=1 Tax=Anisodus tanguticus TaxID=243964 RepID=A0AAE1R973_9SOLA|nr:hypothetical protein RND71_032821 [Anisodus tanguticus]